MDIILWVGLLVTTVYAWVLLYKLRSERHTARYNAPFVNVGVHAYEYPSHMVSRSFGYTSDGLEQTQLHIVCIDCRGLKKPPVVATFSRAAGEFPSVPVD